MLGNKNEKSSLKTSAQTTGPSPSSLATKSWHLSLLLDFTELAFPDWLLPGGSNIRIGNLLLA